MKTPLTSSSGASQESEQETHYTKGGPRSSTAATLHKPDEYSDSGESHDPLSARELDHPTS
jgi:hypothetical protein